MTHFNFPADTVGYSLVRFSTKKQADGDSFRRQVAAAETFCRDEQVTLDRSLHETNIRKLGMSALSGSHVIKGPIRKFLAGIESGIVRPGSLLLVSEWNRLTRQISSDALKLTIDLMERGIGIVDLQDRAYYTLDRYNGDVGLQMSLQLKISMAHQYSRNLRHNLNSVWQARRDAARAGTARATNACPEWLEAIDGKHHVRAGRLAVIERIKADRFISLGKAAIATRLNRAGIPAFRTERGWHKSSVERLVKSEALRGIYQPRDANEEPIGEPIPDHYPRVMSDTEWWRMQWPVDGPKAPRGRKSDRVTNLLRDVIKCGCCVDAGRKGGGLVYENKGRGHERLVCNNARRAFECQDRTYHDYTTLEAELLSALALLDFSRFIEKRNPQVEQIAALEGEIANATATVNRLLQDFSARTPRSVSARIATLEANKERLSVELDRLRRDARIAEANANRDCYAEFRAMVAMVATMPDGEERYNLRTRIQTEFRRMIRSARADGSNMVIELVGGAWHRVEILIERSAIRSFRVTSYRMNGIDHETRILFPRDTVIPDDGVAPETAGLFGDFVGMEGRREAAFVAEGKAAE